jgi:hypothetical protein
MISPLLLRNESDERSVESWKDSLRKAHIFNQLPYFFPNHRPVKVEENCSEAIWSKGFSSWYFVDGLIHLFN